MCLIASYHQGSAIFNFYIEEENMQLIGEVVRNKVARELQPDIDLQHRKDLDEHKINQIVNMLNQSYFTEQCGKLIVNVRANGG